MVTLRFVCLLASFLLTATAEQEDDEISMSDNKFVRDREHIKEHLEGKIDFDADKVSPQEMDFYFFKIHDLDQNTLLDGLEIYSSVSHALYHTVSQKVKEGTAGSTYEKLQTRAVDVVDMILKSDDLDGDGYLSYAEYNKARRAKHTLERASEINQDKF